MSTRFSSVGLTGSLSALLAKTSKLQRAVSVTDPRVQSRGLAEQVFGAWFRANVTLPAADPPYPTALAEYRLPNGDLLYSFPGPAIAVFWNRAELLPYDSGVTSAGAVIDPGDAVPPGTYWCYRATLASGALEQRLRLGSAPSLGDVVRALFYIKDFTRSTDFNQRV